MFKSKILLITGGTGSFGNAVAKRLINSDIGEIRIFSRDEKKQDDMRKHYESSKLRFYIGDVRDYGSVINVDDLSGFDEKIRLAADSCPVNVIKYE